MTLDSSEDFTPSSSAWPGETQQLGSAETTHNRELPASVIWASSQYGGLGLTEHLTSYSSKLQEYVFYQTALAVDGLLSPTLPLLL